MLTRSKAKAQELKEKKNTNNHYPLCTYGNNNFAEGFWRSSSGRDADDTESDDDNKCNNLFPFPLESETQVDPEFLNKLFDIIEFAESDHKKTDNSCTVTYFKGFSMCRLCGCRNGSREYTFVNPNTHVRFTIPSGLTHYYKDHNVAPSKEFVDFVMSFPIQTSSDASVAPIVVPATRSNTSMSDAKSSPAAPIRPVLPSPLALPNSKNRKITTTLL